MTRSTNHIQGNIQQGIYSYVNNGLDTLYLDIAPDNFQVISEKRDEAMSTGILMSSDDDYVPAELHLQDEAPQKIELRLKGDWTDHLEGGKWSFRIHIKGDGQLYGMRNFSIQAPETREFLDEWAYHQYLLQKGIMTTHYTFVNVVLNGEHKGIYALEESFAEELIESEEGRQGVLLRFNEQDLWLNQKNFWENGFDMGVGLWITDSSTAQISLYREGMVMRDETLSKEARTAVALLEGFQDDTLPANEVFDVESIGKFYAASDLWAAMHGAAWHNIRFYYNPILGLLEPVVYDGNALHPEDDKNTMAMVFASDKMFAAPEIRAAYAKYLQQFSNSEDLNFFEDSVSDDFILYQSALEKEYFQQEELDALKSPWSDLRRRAEMLTLQLNVEKPVYGIATANWLETSDGSQPVLQIDLQNRYLLPMSLVSIQIDGKTIPLQPDMVNIDTSAAFYIENGLFYLLPKDVLEDKSPITGQLSIPFEPSNLQEGTSQMVLNTQIAGTNIFKQVHLILQAPQENPLSSFRPAIPSLETALSQHPYLYIIDDETHILGITQGNWMIQNDIILPYGYSLELQAGTTLRFASDTILYSTGALIFKGTEENPVILEAQNDRWPGMVVIRAGEESIIQNTIIRDTASIQRGGWILSGGVTFYDSPVIMDHLTIDGTYAEDSINIIRTTYEFNNSIIMDTTSDGIDSDFSDGSVTNCRFERIGGDAVDINGSLAEVYNSVFTNIADKAVSIGEHSSILVQDVDIVGTGFGVASKDSSNATLLRVNIAGARNAAIAAYQKKSVFGPASINGEEINITNCERISIIQIGSSAQINGTQLETIDQSYDELVNQGLLGN